MTHEETPIGYSDLVRGNANFRLVWFSQLISLLGDWFNLIAATSLIAILTQSGTALGGLLVLYMLGPFLVSPVSGVVIDRYNRKYVIIAANIAQALTVLGFLWVRDASQIWILYVLTAIQQILSGFLLPTQDAMLPEIVSPREIGTANTLINASWSVMLTIGAALGGLVASTLGIYWAFTIDALTFFAAAILMGWIAYTPTSKTEAEDNSISAALQEYVDGLRYLKNHIDILFIALHNAANALIISVGIMAMQVSISQQVFIIGSDGGLSLGLMFGATGIGTGIGPFLARRLTGDRDRPLRWAITAGYGISCLGLLMVAPLAGFWMVLLGFVVRGIGGGLVTVLPKQLLMQLTPNYVRGRIFSTEYALFSMFGAMGGAATGRALDSGLGLSGVITMAAVLILIPGLLWTVWIGWVQTTQSVTDDASLETQP